MLSTYWSSNVPMVIGLNGKLNLNKLLNKYDFNNNSGEIDDDINFTYDTNTEVYYSCAASLNGEMWVLGGYNHKRQVNFK